MAGVVMMVCWSSFVCLLTLVISVGGHEGHEHYQPREDHSEDLYDKRLKEDREHLKEDIERYLKLNPQMLNEANAEQLHYFYFVMHDFDKNNKLDGSEMSKAVIHIVEHRNHTEGGREQTLSYESLAGAIDRVLRDDDLDQDGYLSYAEFVVAQNKQEREQAARRQATANDGQQPAN